MAQNENPKVLIIVENLTLPLDRRVWQEVQSLRDAGYTVSVICPKGGKFTATYELLEGVHIFRHPLPLEADGALGYGIEYASAIFWEFVLSLRAHFKVGFDVVQACNPRTSSSRSVRSGNTSSVSPSFSITTISTRNSSKRSSVDGASSTGCSAFSRR